MSENARHTGGAAARSRSSCCCEMACLPQNSQSFRSLAVRRGIEFIVKSDASRSPMFTLAGKEFSRHSPVHAVRLFGVAWESRAFHGSKNLERW